MEDYNFSKKLLASIAAVGGILVFDDVILEYFDLKQEQVVLGENINRDQISLSTKSVLSKPSVIRENCPVHEEANRHSGKSSRVIYQGVLENDDLSNAHKDLFKDLQTSADVATVGALRAEFSRESANDHSVTFAAAELEGSIYRLAVSQQIDIVSVACNARLCQIQAFIYSDSPADDWAALLEALRGEKVWENFSEDSSIMSDENGRSAALTFIRNRSSQ